MEVAPTQKSLPILLRSFGRVFLPLCHLIEKKFDEPSVSFGTYILGIRFIAN